MSEAPGAMALNEATHRLYVAEMSGIQVVDTLTGATVARISLPPTSIGVLPVSPAVDLAVNARTNTLYATDLFRGQLVVMDGATNSVVDRVSVGRSPWGVAVNATTNRIYVANSKSDTVSVIDGSSRKVTATVAMPDAFLVATAETGNRIYLSTSNGLAVLDGSTNRVLETLAYGLVPFAVGDFPRRVYGNDGSGVRVFDIDSGSRSGSLSGRYVTGLAVDTRADRLYVAEELTKGGVLRVFSGDGSRDLGSVPLDASPHSVIAEPSSGRAYIGMSTEGCSPLSPGICQSSVLVVGAGDSVSVAAPAAPIAAPTPTQTAARITFDTRLFTCSPHPTVTAPGNWQVAAPRTPVRIGIDPQPTIGLRDKDGGNRGVVVDTRVIAPDGTAWDRRETFDFTRLGWLEFTYPGIDARRPSAGTYVVLWSVQGRTAACDGFVLQ